MVLEIGKSKVKVDLVSGETRSLVHRYPSSLCVLTWQNGTRKFSFIKALIPFTFCQTSPPRPVRLGWPHTAWLSFIELDKAVSGPCDQTGLFSVIMVSVCLPSDALSQHLPSYLGFSYLGHGVSLHGCSSKAQLLLLTLDEGVSSRLPFLTLNIDVRRG